VIVVYLTQNIRWLEGGATDQCREANIWAEAENEQVELYESSGGTEGTILRDTGLPVIILTHIGNKTGAIPGSSIDMAVDGWRLSRLSFCRPVHRAGRLDFFLARQGGMGRRALRRKKILDAGAMH
jgi:hypothetical protein